jgi:hypothetical protein
MLDRAGDVSLLATLVLIPLEDWVMTGRVEDVDAAVISAAPTLTER